MASSSSLISNQTNVSTALGTLLLTNNQHSNVVFSPLSIQTLLSLLAAGSKDQTLDQLLAFLKVDTKDDLNSLYSELVSLILADGSPVGGPRLSFANAVWVHKTLPLKPSFKQVVDTVYKGTCEQADFEKAVEVASEVNLWGQKQTNGLINQVISAEQVKNGIMLILANAIYFKGTWTQKFNKSWTIERYFHLLNGSKVKVPFMTSSKNQFVREYDGFKVLGLPYYQGQDNRKFSMYFYLSDAKDGLPSLIKKIGSTSNFIEHHIPPFKAMVREFFIPKFKIEFGFEASDMLKELGLVLPFGVGHHVTEMVDSPVGTGLYVPEIHQKSVVEVNEEGTEAAAVSFGVMSFGCAATVPKVVDFVADHPFLFVIREDVTRIVLFMGQVSDPSLSI
ncbi:putative Serpin family protein [Helianthus annuus]|uniref:Putative serpin n=1 Tax=Helianthus annuus TaxID=4232 RepID=A0A251UT44_HELAN|nr:serpin-ZX [Helianthus annuus]KAF5806101.1 putative Serpin family protein [Helianthus annuus]KAJ0584758.1 putative Serpin family protein [Helianthus annuus]KAJ0919172.1 putative Serpin family protein [Helianthus annuus]